MAWDGDVPSISVWAPTAKAVTFHLFEDAEPATTSTTTTTMGQELMDLDKAYRDGIISKDQYEKSKKQILKRYDD